MKPITESDYSDLIGVEWVRGGDQPNGIDCWGVVRLICERRGLSVPSPDSIDDHAHHQALTIADLPGWERVPNGQELPGDVGAYSFEGHCVDHTGVLIEPDLVLHARKETGCIALKKRVYATKLVGWYRPGAAKEVATEVKDAVGDDQSGVVVVHLYRNIMDSSDFDTMVCDWTGEDCASYLPSEIPIEDTAVSINGERLSGEDVTGRSPKPGDVVTAVAVPGITAAFLASAVGASTVGFGFTVAAFALNALFSVGISFLLKALTAPPRPSVDQDPIDSSPTFSQSGIRNSIAAGGMIPVVFGKHRIGGQIIGTYNSITDLQVTNFNSNSTTSPVNTPSNQFSINQNTHQASATGGKTGLALLIAVSEGEIESANGLATDTDSFSAASLAPGSLLVNGNDAADFTGVTCSFRSGTINQEPIPFFSDTVNAVGIEINLRYAQPWTYTTSEGVDAFAVQLFESAGHYRIAGSAAQTRFKPVDYRFKYRPVGATAWTFDQVVNRYYLNRAAHSWELRVDNLNGGIYEIYLERLTLDDDDAFFINSGDQAEVSLASINAVNEITYGTSSHPGIALVAVSILATDQINGVPTVTSLVEGKKWWVWDGVSETNPDFTFKYTRNPGEILPGLLLNKNFGFGQYVDLEDIDLASFKALADYCDEQISDGRGGTMARCRLDMVYDVSEKGGDLLDKILTVCRSSLVPVAGKLSVKTHKARTVTHMFTEANVKDVRIGWTDGADRPNRFNVTFPNAELDYDVDTVSIEDENVIDGKFIDDTITVIGTTKPARAMRIAQHRLNVAGIKKTLGFTGAIDSIVLSPGDVFWFSSHEMSTNFVSGRVVAATSSSISLDQDVELVSGTTYGFKVMVESGGSISIQSATHTAATSSTVTAGTAITVSGLTVTPSKSDVYAFGTQSNHVEAYECIECPLNEKLERTVSAIQYDATVYDDDPGEVPASTDELFDPRKFPAPVTGVTLTNEARVKRSGDIHETIAVGWTGSKEFEKAEIYTRSSGDGDQWVFVGIGENGRYQITDFAKEEVVEVSVVPISAAGNSRSPVFGTTASIFASGRLVQPSPVTNLVAANGESGVLLCWDEPDDRDIKAYKIKVGSNWGGALEVATVPACTNRIEVPTAFYQDKVADTTYFVKAINSSGVSSEAASISYAYANRNTLIDENNEESAWTGTKTGFVVSGGELVSVDGVTSASYVANNVNAQTLEDLYLTTTQEVSFRDKDAPTWETAGFAWNSQGAKVRNWNNDDFTDLPDSREDALKTTWRSAGFAWNSALATGRTWQGLSESSKFSVSVKSKTANTEGALTALAATPHEFRISNDRYGTAELAVTVPHSDYQIKVASMSVSLHHATPAKKIQFPRQIIVNNDITSGTFTALTKCNYNNIVYETGGGNDYSLASNTVTLNFNPPSEKVKVTHHTTVQIDANSVTQCKTEVYYNGALYNEAKVKTTMINATQHGNSSSNETVIDGVSGGDTISVRTTRMSGSANIKHTGAACTLTVEEIIEEL